MCLCLPLFIVHPARANVPLDHETALSQFESTRSDIEQSRKKFLRQYQSATTASQRQSVLREAEKYLTAQFYLRIAPAWLGTPWTMAVINDGLKPDARVPHQPGKGVSCSWFVVSALENLGLRIGNPSGFAGTIAVHLQRSLSPQKRDFRRIFNVTPKQLQQKMVLWGDGLYIVGLNCHIGFLHVQGDNVTFIHSDYTDAQQVVMEDVTDSDAIDYSQQAGYVVSALFRDNRLIYHWLTGARIYFNGPKK